MRLVVPTFVVIAAIAAGCGESNESSSTAGEVTTTTTTTTTVPETTADEDAIREAISTLATESDPDVCEESLTQDFLDQAYPPAGPGALEECRSLQRPQYKLEAESVRFTEIEVDGEEATATFELLGPGVGGAVNTVLLVRTAEGTWQIDDFGEAEITDRSRFDASLRATATNGPAGVSAAQADCLVEETSQLSDSALERRAVGENRYLPVPIVAECVGDGTAVGAVAEFVRLTLEADPSFEEFADCTARRTAQELSPADATAFLRSEDRETLQDLTARAAAACGASAVPAPEGTLT